MAKSSPRTILIVEDQKEKSRALRECLEEALPGYVLQETDTILVAGQLIDLNLWSGVVLDLSFRRSQQAGSRFNRPFLAGLEILQQLNEMRVDLPVIIATQHSSFDSTKYGDYESIDDLRAMLSEAFPRNYRELIQIKLGGNEWRRELAAASRRHFL